MQTQESTVKCWTDVRGRLCSDICAYIIKNLSNLASDGSGICFIIRKTAFSRLTVGCCKKGGWMSMMSRVISILVPQNFEVRFIFKVNFDLNGF